MTDNQPIRNIASRRSRGGPRTDAGKTNSRLNAVKHGLTATTLLPLILSAESIAVQRERLRDEWQPATTTQELLVDEMARHAAALEFIERAEPAVLRTGSLALAGLHSDAVAVNDDIVLTGAVSNDAVERLTRYRRTHEKGFHQALARLQEFRCKAPVSPAPIALIEPPFVFTEENCQTYLIRRLNSREHRCPHCGESAGYWLATRLLWQCGFCQRQCGIRGGTVMAHSRLALPVWFRAIWRLLIEPDVAIAKLANVAKIARAATVRDIVARVRDAQTADNASTLLAGLDVLACRQRAKNGIATQR